MRPPVSFGLLADTVLLIHAAFVLFVLAGLLLTIVGGLRGWHWIRNPWFRLAHLAAIGYVVAESWFGIDCPLTVLELRLRSLAGQVTYEGEFIAYWVRRFLFYDASPAVFALIYSAFGALVVFTWIRFPPGPLFRGERSPR